MQTESLVIRAELRNEVSAPVKAVRADISGLREEVKGAGKDSAKAGDQLGTKLGSGIDKAKKAGRGLKSEVGGLRDEIAGTGADSAKAGDQLGTKLGTGIDKAKKSGQGLKSELGGLRDEIKGAGKDGEESGDQLGAGIDKAAASGEGLKSVLEGVRNTGAVMTLGFAGAVAIISSFESSVSELKAASSATNDELDQMRTAAIEAGKGGIFTETNAVQGMTAMAKAGLSVTDMLNGGLTGAINLAAAGGLGLEDASEKMASALTTFDLNGSQATHVADVLAAGAGKAQGEVSDLSMGLSQAGLVAKNTGLSLDETVGTLAMFASKALLGSDAGTSLKTMLMRLTPQSQQANDLVNKLGISAYDAAGRFIGLSNYAELLKTKLSGMSKEQRNSTLNTVFGSDAVRAATALYESGAAGVQHWTKEVGEAGYAAKYAAIRTDNLAGDTAKLRGSLQALITGSGSGTNTMLRTMTQHLTNDVELFAKIPKPIASAGLALTGIMGASVTAIAGLGLVIPKMTALQTSLKAGGKGSQAMAVGVGAARSGLLWAVPVLALGAAAFDYFGQKAAKRKKDVEGFTQAVIADGLAVGKNTVAMVAKNLSDEGAFKAAGKLGLAQVDLTESLMGNAAARNRVNAALKEGLTIQTAADGITPRVDQDRYRAAQKLVGIMADQASKMADAQREARDLALAENATSTVQQKVADSTGKSTDQIYRQSQAMQDATDSASALKSMLDDLNAVNLTAAQADVAYHQSLLSINSTVKAAVEAKTAHARALGVDTEAGLANRTNIIQAVQQAMAMAQAVSNQTGEVAKGAAAFSKMREEIRRHAYDAKLDKKEVDKLLASIAVLPTLKPTLPVRADTKPAKEAVHRFALGLNSPTVTRPPMLPVKADVTPAKDDVHRFVLGLNSPTVTRPPMLPVKADTKPAAADVNRWKAELGRDPVYVQVVPVSPGSQPVLPSASSGGRPVLGPGGRAAAFGGPLGGRGPLAGPIRGPGSARSDSISLVSNGEWIVPWDAREKYGDRLLADITNGTYPKHAPPGPDTGGAPAAGPYAGGIVVEAGAVQVHVAGGTPQQMRDADIPGQVAAGVAQYVRDQAER